MTKDELLGIVKTLYNNFLLGQVYNDVCRDHWDQFHEKVKGQNGLLPFRGYVDNQFYNQEV
ncbi:MAG: hypothetical protein JKY52_14520 [Flavobacteriales bacterium]|nr:hypothetical protein [Flavobacteriales bacterium]